MRIIIWKIIIPYIGFKLMPIEGWCKCNNFIDDGKGKINKGET